MHFHSWFGVGIQFTQVDKKPTAVSDEETGDGDKSVAGHSRAFWKEGCKESLEKNPYCAHK